MTAPLDSDRIAQLLPSYEYALLISVSDDYVPHTAAIVPVYREGIFDIGSVGKHRWANLTRHPAVTLVFPSPTVEQHSLIIDGMAHLPEDPQGSVTISIINALLHRSITAPKTGPHIGIPFECIQITPGKEPCS